MPAKIWLSVTCLRRDALEIERRHRDRRRQERRLQVHEHQRAPQDRVDVEVLQHRQEDRHEDDDDLGPFQRPAEHEDDRLRQEHELTGDMLSDSTHCSSSACPPRIANTPENSAEPTNSQHTMAVVFAVRNTASLVRFQSSVLACTASRKAPAAPTPADSVAVVIPNRITPSTTTVRMPSGIVDEVSSFTICEPLGVKSPVVAHLQQRAARRQCPRTRGKIRVLAPVRRAWPRAYSALECPVAARPVTAASTAAC